MIFNKLFHPATPGLEGAGRKARRPPRQRGLEWVGTHGTRNDGDLECGVPYFCRGMPQRCPVRIMKSNIYFFELSVFFTKKRLRSRATQ